MITPFYLCGFPKAGLHMVEQAMSVFASPIAKNNWVGTTAWRGEIAFPETMLEAALTLAPGTYAKGHAAYTAELEQRFYSLGVGFVFVYRDLRDVVVSQANHIIRAEGEKLKHPGADLYRAMDSYEDILIAIIEGLNEYVGIFERWELFAGWLRTDWTFKVRYEDMRRRDKATCRDLYEYALSINPEMRQPITPEDATNEMVARVRNRKNSVTFYKGKIGGWEKSFTPRVVDCFKAHDPGWLAELKYAKDNNW